MDKLSYAFGFGVANQFKQMKLDGKLVVKDFAECVETLLKGEEPKMTTNEVDTVIKGYFEELSKEANAVAEKNAEAGKAFLEENRKKKGITTTESGLQYETLRDGEGDTPTLNSIVTCHYEGRLLDGTVFDSSYNRGESALFPLCEVIPGWSEGLQYMRVGGKYRLFVPEHLAYGNRGAGSVIPPCATLIFDIELLSIEDEIVNENNEVVNGKENA